MHVRLTVAAAVAALACSAATGAHAQDTIRVGVPMELSGKFVAYGAPGKRGAEMAAEAFNHTVAGKKLELLIRDVQSDAQTTVSVINELVSQAKVNYMIGPIGSPIVAAAIPAWQQGKPLWLVPGSSSTKLEEVAGAEPMFFHTYPYAYHYHTSEAAALKHYLGAGKKVAVIYSDDAYGRTHLPYVQKYYKEAGYTIVAEELVRTNATDLNPVLTKIRVSKPDILIGLVQTTDAITLAKQIHTRRLDVPVLVGTAYTQLDEWRNAVGEAQEGWLGVTTYLPGAQRAANKDYPQIFPSLTEWEDKFRKRFNAEPDFLDIGTYATAAMLFLAIDRAGVDDREKVAAELRKMDLPTVFGQGNFKPTEGGTRQQAFTDMVVFQNQGGKNVVLYPLADATGKLQPLKR